MFDKLGQAAEKLATHVSRRAFLGRLGQGALGLAATVGGMLAFPAQAQAGNGGTCCLCASRPSGLICRKNRGGCGPACYEVACRNYPAICPQ
jgi:hypothetical protein